MISGDFPKSGIALPLGNRRVRASALRALSLYKGKDFWSRAKIRLLEIFNFSFIWRMLFRKKFVMSPDSEWGNIFSFLERELSTFNLQLSTLAFSIYVGSGKYNLPLFDAKSGKALGHAKAYFPESAEYGENEIRILKELEQTKIPDFLFPEVLSEGYARKFFVAVLSPLPEETKRARAIGEKHLEFLRRLSETTGKRAKFEDSDFYREFEKEMEFLKSAPSEESGLMERVWNESLERLKGKEFLFSLTKREFPFFEMFKSNVNGQTSNVVIDWEHARYGWPPLFDVFNLCMSEGRFKRGEYAQIYEKNIKDIFFGKNKKTGRALKKMLAYWKIPDEDTYWFFRLYLLDQLSIHLRAGHGPSAARVIAFLEKVG